MIARVLFGIAKELFKCRVAQLDARRQIFDNDGQRIYFNQRIQEAGALFQLLLGPAPFGDVQERDHGSHDLLAADDGMGPILCSETGSIAAPEEFVVHVRSEEHTSELQSHLNLVCRLLLEKKKTQQLTHRAIS